MVGLGGGVIIIQILAIFLRADIHSAIGASIVSVMATPSGAAATYVKDKTANLRMGMFLELATTMGAITGAAVAAYANSFVLELIFRTILLAARYGSMTLPASSPTIPIRLPTAISVRALRRCFRGSRRWTHSLSLN